MPSIRVLRRFAGFEVLSASRDSSALFLVAFSWLRSDCKMLLSIVSTVLVGAKFKIINSAVY